MQFERYAIYFTPPEGAFADFGTAWLGWDMAAARRIAHPPVDGLPMPIADLTEAPRKYGLHATIKPPFRLADGTSAEELAGSLGDFCDNVAPIALHGLDVARIGRFLALVARGNAEALEAMAARIVREFDVFRAPPSEAEITRRRAAHLTREQEANLLEWGYPYVMDQFRFHITLTGKLPRSTAETTRKILAGTLDGILPEPFDIDGLSLAGEDTTGLFHLIHRYTFSG